MHAFRHLNIAVLIFLVVQQLAGQQLKNSNTIEIINQSGRRQVIAISDFEHKKEAFATITLESGDSTTILSNSQYSYYSIRTAGPFNYFFKDKQNPVHVRIGIDSELSVSGSTIHLAWEQFRTGYDSLRSMAMNHRGDTAKGVLLQRNFEQYFLQAVDRLVEIDSFMAVRAFVLFASDIQRFAYANPDIIDQILNKFYALNLNNHPLTNKNSISADLNRVAWFREGAELDNFWGISPDMDTVNVDHYLGKPVLLVFWASWCGPCRNEGREIKQCFSQITASKLEILGVSIDENRASWQLALEQDAYPWAQMILLGKEKKRVQETYLVYGIPKSILVSGSGKILKINPTVQYLKDQAWSLIGN